MAPRTGWQPVYAQIADELRAKITSGQLGAGDRLPTEEELQERYGVARGTVQKGLAQLVSEGLVVAQRPKGHFVRSMDRLQWAASTDEQHEVPVDWWVDMVRQQGFEPSQSIKVEIMEPQPPIAERLQLQPGEFAVVRRRLRSINGRPSAIWDSYYPETFAGGTALAQPADITRGGRHVLAELGHKMCFHRDEITARAPRPEEAASLHIPPGTPLIEHMRTSCDTNDRPVRCMVAILPGDRYTLTYTRRD